VGKKVQLALYPEAPVSHTAVAIWTTDSLSCELGVANRLGRDCARGGGGSEGTLECVRGMCV
jgi:hypothetical protein